ncbi:hypothetical protein DP42_3890 [Burkholderia pseudomallei]|nr:hypothetical protein DP42_3890 [Burkholderia pseudomallei]
MISINADIVSTDALKQLALHYIYNSPLIICLAERSHRARKACR